MRRSGSISFKKTRSPGYFGDRKRSRIWGSISNNYELVPATAASLCLRAFALGFWELGNEFWQGFASWPYEKTHDWSCLTLFFSSGRYIFYHFSWIFRQLWPSLMHDVYIFKNGQSWAFSCCRYTQPCNLVEFRFPALKNQIAKTIPVRSK